MSASKTGKEIMDTLLRRGTLHKDTKEYLTLFLTLSIVDSLETIATDLHDIKLRLKWKYWQDEN